MSEIIKYIDKLASKTELSKDEAARAIQISILGGATPAQIAAFLMGIKIKNVSYNELTGAIDAVKNKLKKAKLPYPVMTVSGTGNLHNNNTNLFLAICLILAANNIKVAKYVNGFCSASRSSNDMLSRLGVNLNCSFEQKLECLNKANIAFFHDDNFSFKFREIINVTSDLQIKTLFDLITPLIAPFEINAAYIGCYSIKNLPVLKKALDYLNCQNFYIASADDFSAYASLKTITNIVGKVNNKAINLSAIPNSYNIIPQESEISTSALNSDINVISRFLEGTDNRFRSLAIYNATLALLASGIVSDKSIAKEMAIDAIDSGKAKNILNQINQFTNK